MGPTRPLNAVWAACLAATTLALPAMAAPQRVAAAPAATRSFVQAAGPWSPARRLLGQGLQGPGLAGPGWPQPVRIRIAQATLGWLSATAPAVDRGEGAPSPLAGGTALNLKLVVPSTGLEEFFTLHVPPLAPGVEAPLVVAFHSYGRTHLEIAGATDLVDEAAARGWFLLAPVQRAAVGDPLVNYGSVQSQDHVEAVLAWVLRTYAVDRDRIFGVGFSMGGGSAMSYGARHRDRRRGAFAAVANHTGSVALAHVYAEEPLAQGQLELLMGGTPAQAPYDYQRSSTLELDATGALVPGGRHMAVNLGFVPVRTYYALNDALAYLVAESLALDGFLQAVPGSAHQLVPVTAPASCLNVAPPLPVGHCWESMPTAAVFDWFSQQSLVEVPPAGSVLADRGGRWSGIDLVQDGPRAFSSFDYMVDPASGRLELRSLANVRSLTVDLARAGFAASAPVRCLVDAVDGTGHMVSFRGLMGRPSSVTRNGLGAVESCVSAPFPSWCYDQSTGVLTVVEPSATLGDWVITP